MCNTQRNKMKELNTFRKFLNEGEGENSEFPLIYVKDEDWLETFDRERLDYEVEDENSQKGIGIRVFTPEDHNKLKSILGKLAWNEDLSENTQHNIMKELNTFRKFLNEGTWSYGSENQMIKALEEMNAMLMHSDPRQLKAGLDAMDNALYRIFGDDDFHDSLGAAQDFAAEGDLDRAKNALSDTMGIGDRMIASIHGMDGDLEENDMALDEIIGEEKESLTQQIMKKYPKKYKDEKAVKAAAKELMKDPKYKANRGIFPVLYALLKGK